MDTDTSVIGRVASEWGGQDPEVQKKSGICPHCVQEHREKTLWKIEGMAADHITPCCAWSTTGGLG